MGLSSPSTVRTLVAIKSCVAHRDREDAQRATWAKSCLWGMADQVYWFTGKTLGVPDDYEHLPFKTQAICRYAHLSRFDRCFLADTDTYIALDRLFSYPLYKHKYAGYELPQGYASGGAGYWLDQKAMLAVANALPHTGNEDEWVGAVLKDQGIKLHHDSRFALFQPVLPDNDVISCHLSSKGPFTPEIMYLAHKAYDISKPDGSHV